MTSSTAQNDRFPYDPRHLIYAILLCAALAAALPTDRTGNFAGLLSVAIPLLPVRR